MKSGWDNPYQADKQHPTGSTIAKDMPFVNNFLQYIILIYNYLQLFTQNCNMLYAIGLRIIVEKGIEDFWLV